MYSPITLLPESIQSRLPDFIPKRSHCNREEPISSSRIERMIKSVISAAGTVFSTWLTFQVLEIAKTHAVLYSHPQLQTTKISTQSDYQFINIPRIADGFNYGVGALIPLLLFGRLGRFF